MTFDILSDVAVGEDHGWVHYHEITALCRNCSLPSLKLIRLTDYDLRNNFGKNGSVSSLTSDVTGCFEFRRDVSVADRAAVETPDHLPADIAKAFNEGTRCLAIGCHNASAAMFRLCLDMATKSLLPPEDESGNPNKQQRRNLAPRLRWLIDNGKISEDLRDLSTAVKEHGDEGVHEGALDESDADDLYDFAFALLDRLYTQPARLEAAKLRREARKPAIQAKASV